MKQLYAIFFLLFFTGTCIGETRIDAMVSLLERAPAWSAISEDNISQKAPDLTLVCIQMSKLSISDIRMVISRYLARYPTKDCNVDAWSKIYVFNRFYFKSEGVLAPSGWLRHKATTGNTSWPWREIEGGNLVLSGVFAGYSGAPYDGLKEFDYFMENFKRR